MNKLQLTGAALAVGAAAMFAFAPVYAADAAAPTVKCKGVNACSGKGQCKTKANACSGKNQCKGQGVMPMTQDECNKAKGTVAE
jgi:hypothetical protein